MQNLIRRLPKLEKRIRLCVSNMFNLKNVNFRKNILVTQTKYFLYNNNSMMKSTDENRRIVDGTEHSITKTEGKIGGGFEKTTKAKFLEERVKSWDEFYSQQEEYKKSLPREKIVITLKDGKQVEGLSFDTSPLDLAKKFLKKSLVGDLLAAKVRYTRKVVDLNEGLISAEDEEDSNGHCCNSQETKAEMWDLSRPLEGDCHLEFVTFEDKEGKAVFWHSSAHILGSAIENAYGSYLCIGPALEEGFYYDSYMGKNVIEE